MNDKYKVAKGKKLMVNVFDGREVQSYFFDDKTKAYFEIEGMDLWLIDSDGKRYLTDDYPAFHLNNGELEKI